MNVTQDELQAARPPVATRRRRGALRRERRLGLILIMPSVLLLVGIVGYPLGYSIYLSLLHYNLLSAATQHFTGLGNFVLLFQMAEFWQAAKNTIIITAATTFFQIILAFALALLFRKPFPGRMILRGVFILPWPLPTFIVAFAFVWLLDYNYGLINHLLVAAHLPAYAFLGEPTSALISVIAANIWKEIPWTFVVMTAAMALVPHELLEAVRVDGGRWWAEVRHVIVPSMQRILVLIIVLRVIWTFNFFDLVFLMTGGGPLQSTLVLPVMVYDMMFNSFQVGLAAAIGALMVVVLSAFAVVLLWAQSRVDR